MEEIGSMSKYQEWRVGYDRHVYALAPEKNGRIAALKEYLKDSPKEVSREEQV